MTEGTRRAREKEDHETGCELSLGPEELVTSPLLQALFRDVLRVESYRGAFFRQAGQGSHMQRTAKQTALTRRIRGTPAVEGNASRLDNATRCLF